MCVEGTLRDSADRGFGCVLVDDACGADSEEYHEAACVVIQRLYGSILTTQQVIDSLEGSPPASEQEALQAPVVG